jgi:5-methylcytosine-specific restriction enzyme subunit McrC
MVTDVSIITPDGYLILGTKYYKEALEGQYDKKVISSNLYQIFSYVKNVGSKGDIYENCSGVLLYPTVDYDLDLNYIVQGHSISIRTLDLSKPWDEIEERLLAIV